MKHFHLALAMLFLTVSTSVAQQNWCGLNEYRQVLDAQYPGYSLMTEQAREQMMRQLAENPDAGQVRGGVRTIPVVFHVVWNTTAENVSDQVIMQQLARLNADFSTSYQNTQVAQFQSVATNPMIQFCLATTDPQGNPTTGITRTQTSVTSFAVGNDMKSNSTGGRNPWPFNSYYNIWICDIGFNPSTGGTAGFAYLPSFGTQFEAIDGTVLAYQVVGGNETTLSHETGHYLGLHHTWGVDFESCSDDDGFTDTPNCVGPNYGTWQNNFCPLNAQSCQSLDNVENFMDYASCPTMFTQQQSAYMNNILSTPYGNSWPTFQAGRAGLISSNGCAGQQQGNAPVADFVGNPTTVPVGVNVSFTDLSTNSPTNWAWTFGDGGTSNAQNPTHSYAAPGLYTVQLTASNGNGSDVETKQNYINVTQGGGGGSTTCDSLVYLDGRFIAQVNPIDDPNFNAFFIDNDQAAVYSQLASAGFTSNWMQFYEVVAPGDTNWSWGATSWHEDFTIDADNWITFGPITIPSDGADLEWKHSFYNMSFRDGYRVMLNLTGTNVANFNGGTVLFSVADNDPSTVNDVAWASRSVNLPGGTYAGQQVYIGFNHNASDMYALFLDEIYMHGCNTAPVAVNPSRERGLVVFPNPARDQFTVRFENSDPSTQLILMNSLGQQVWRKGLTGQGQITEVVDTRSLPSGVYTLILNGPVDHTHVKLVLTK
jgi:PKD repeat protein